MRRLKLLQWSRCQEMNWVYESKSLGSLAVSMFFFHFLALTPHLCLFSQHSKHPSRRFEVICLLVLRGLGWRGIRSDQSLWPQLSPFVFSSSPPTPTPADALSVSQVQSSRFGISDPTEKLSKAMESPTSVHIFAHNSRGITPSHSQTQNLDSVRRSHC